MRICVTAVSGSLEAQIDPRFGRCPYFVIVDSETMKFEAVPNTASGSMSGAGIQAAQKIAGKGVEILITGNVGPKAFQALSTTTIRVVTDAFGNVREVIEKFKGGKLKETSSPTVRGHFGMGTGRDQKGW